jgi:two-component system LytT family response regulator
VLRVIVVDDEAPARRYLRRLLEAHADVSIAGEAATGQEAARLIHTHRPDAVFLDIELTHGTGFDVLAGLDTPPAVVFVTAHADHAVRAFDVAAADYLLKPVGAQRLHETLARLRQAVTGGLGAETAAQPATAQTHLVARSRNGLRQLKLETLSAVLAQGDYVMLCCADGTSELIHGTLTGLRPQLPSPPFFQASRSIVVNLEQVIRVAGGEQKYVEFAGRAAPLELGPTAFDRLRREIALGGKLPGAAAVK